MYQPIVRGDMHSTFFKRIWQIQKVGVKRLKMINVEFKIYRIFDRSTPKQDL